MSISKHLKEHAQLGIGSIGENIVTVGAGGNYSSIQAAMDAIAAKANWEALTTGTVTTTVSTRLLADMSGLSTYDDGTEVWVGLEPGVDAFMPCKILSDTDAVLDLPYVRFGAQEFNGNDLDGIIGATSITVAIGQNGNIASGALLSELTAAGYGPGSQVTFDRGKDIQQTVTLADPAVGVGDGIAGFDTIKITAPLTKNMLNSSWSSKATRSISYNLIKPIRTTIFLLDEVYSENITPAPFVSIIGSGQTIINGAAASLPTLKFNNDACDLKIFGTRLRNGNTLPNTEVIVTDPGQGHAMLTLVNSSVESVGGSIDGLYSPVTSSGAQLGRLKMINTNLIGNFDCMFSPQFLSTVLRGCRFTLDRRNVSGTGNALKNNAATASFLAPVELIVEGTEFLLDAALTTDGMRAINFDSSGGGGSPHITYGRIMGNTFRLRSSSGDLTGLNLGTSTTEDYSNLLIDNNNFDLQTDSGTAVDIIGPTGMKVGNSNVGPNMAPATLSGGVVFANNG